MSIPSEPPPPPDSSAPSRPAFDFGGFVARHAQRLRALVLRRVGDPHDAEEILQEALLRAHKHQGKFADEDAAAAWTTVVAQRLVIDRQRVSSRSVSVAELPEPTPLGVDPGDIVVARSEAQAALEVLASLPRRQAAVLWAREVEGLSYAEIGARHGLAEPTVRATLHRARQALRKEFVRRGHSVPAGGLVPLAPMLLLLRHSADLGRPGRRGVEAQALLSAAVAVLAVGAVGAALPSPWAQQPGGAPPTWSRGEHVAAMAAAPTARAAHAAPVTSVEVEAPATLAVRLTPREPAGAVLRVPRTCVGTAAVGGCAESELPRGGDRLVVNLRLPPNPAGISKPGVQTGASLLCKQVPTNPFVSCTNDPQDGDR